jgi:uncharacterized protein (TIGR03118 family)
MVAALVAAPALVAGPVGIVVANLVSNQIGVAPNRDPNLVNAWGLASSASSPFWVGDNGAGKSTVYNSSGTPNAAILVTIPGDGTVTGVTATGSGGFNGDAFLFASEDGTVSGWRAALGLMGTAEVLQLASPANEYKGITYGSTGGFQYAYLANFGTGAIDVLKGSGGAPNLAGTFTDPGLPAGYAPFNIQNLGGMLYVAYALKNGADEQAGPGLGFVTRFDLDGQFQGRIATNGALNAPWGLALAPAGFLNLGGLLLVGNFGDGTIHAYDPTTSGGPIATLTDLSGSPIAIDGLWALRVGNGGQGGSPGVVYFTAGPNGESDGLLGSLTPNPEPGTWLSGGAVVLLALWRRSRRSRVTAGPKR